MRAGGEIETELLIDSLDHWLQEAEGLTISGGEPLEQAEAVAFLIRELRHRFRGDVALYSGYSWEQIKKLAPEVVELVDVLISDPYEPLSGARLNWRGSDNQRLHVLSTLGRDRWGDDAEFANAPSKRRLDVFVDGEQVWMAGIPAPGDIQKFLARLASRGYTSKSSEAAGVICRS